MKTYDDVNDAVLQQFAETFHESMLRSIPQEIASLLKDGEIENLLASNLGNVYGPCVEVCLGVIIKTLLQCRPVTLGILGRDMKAWCHIETFCEQLGEEMEVAAVMLATTLTTLMDCVTEGVFVTMDQKSYMIYYQDNKFTYWEKIIQ